MIDYSELVIPSCDVYPAIHSSEVYFLLQIELEARAIAQCSAHGNRDIDGHGSLSMHDFIHDLARDIQDLGKLGWGEV